MRSALVLVVLNAQKVVQYSDRMLIGIWCVSKLQLWEESKQHQANEGCPNVCIKVFK